MNKGDRTFPIGRKEKERKRATETRLSFIDGCRDVSLPWNSHTFFLSSSALWLPLEEAEKADNYFHAAACSCTWIERVGVPRGTSHSASNTNNYWQTSSMFAETAAAILPVRHAKCSATVSIAVRQGRHLFASIHWV